MENVFANTDYVRRNVEKDTSGQPEYSPMNPPDAYHPPGTAAVPYDEWSPFLKHLADEHKLILAELGKFETALMEVKEGGINKERNRKLGDFFQFLDEIIVLHNLKEERILFPVLHDRLIDRGEKSTTPVPETAIDILENDHIKMMQLITLVFNLMSLSSRLSDPASRVILMDTAVEQGKLLVELIRLHLFREDQVVFSLAHKYLTPAEHVHMDSQLEKYFSIKI